ncbi:MAG TPA: TetR/AcrR family transcriptional regulator [Caulobacteraceae bacterium]|nr:TetR/AcrR family transcriptional regulator [Caulobacteraceae bacterium]
MVKPELSRKRQRTRSALIEATLAIIAERGFAAVSLGEVAARAGVTKGSIYSNFRGKGDLLWAAAGRKRLNVVPEITPGAPLRSHARAIAQALMPLIPQIEREADFHRALLIYSRTDPELGALQAAQWDALFDTIAQGLEAELGERLTIPSRVLALGAQALIRGFVSQWVETPEEVTEQVVAANFEALLVGATTSQNPSAAPAA